MSEKEITGNICAVCGIKAGLKCTGCLAVTYCGKEHQVLDWKKGHKNSCKSYEVSDVYWYTKQRTPNHYSPYPVSNSTRFVRLFSINERFPST